MGSTISDDDLNLQSGETQTSRVSTIISSGSTTIPYIPVYTSVHSIPLNPSHTQTPSLFTPAPSVVFTMTSPHATVSTPTHNTLNTNLPHQLVVHHQTTYGYQGQLPVYTHPSHNPPPYVPHTPAGFHHHFNPMPKIEFPKFDGTEPKGWIIKAEQYFEFICIDDYRKVKLSGLHFEGKASVW